MTSARKLARKKTVLLACAAALAALAVTSFATRARAKPATLLQILTGFSAKESCSCAFVVEQSDAYCQEFGKLEGYDVTVVIDRAARTVTSSFLGASRTARMSDGAGCQLDALP